MRQKTQRSAFQKKVLIKFVGAYKIMFANPFVTSLGFVSIVWLTVPYIVYKFEEGTQGANIVSYADSLWYGIVTMLTVGYGDRYPVTSGGRLWGGFLMAAGVVGIGIVTAKISSFFLERALRDRRGLVDTTALKNHFIICGWKNEMHSLLQHILESNSGMLAEQIVLVNNVSDEDLEALHEFPELKKIKIIKGDFFSAEVLRRAAPERAVKVLILADGTPSAEGGIPTKSEADARTIMAAMTLSNIAKGTPVAAEILDSQMDQYLKLAHVHEVIYSRDYSRLLLAMASTGTGVTNIFHDLLSPQSNHSIGTEHIPSEVIHQTYAKAKELFHKSHPELTLLGILENSGNSHQAKEVALRKAQQTPNIQKLVENLHSVKSLKFNHPVFSPNDDYVINEGSMAIVIRNRIKNGTNQI